MSTIKEIVEEFNPLDSNDSVLGRYVKACVEYLYGDTSKDRTSNEREDKIINEWLTQKLTQVREQAKNELRRAHVEQTLRLLMRIEQAHGMAVTRQRMKYEEALKKLDAKK